MPEKEDESDFDRDEAATAPIEDVDDPDQEPVRHKAPTNGARSVTVNLVERERVARQSTKKQGPDPGPFERAAVAATDDWQRQASLFADDVTWTLERTAPRLWKNKKVPLGTFAEEFHGPVGVKQIGEIAGGGTYFVTFMDPRTKAPRRIGPIHVAEGPKFTVSLQDDESEPESEPFSFRADPEASLDSEWVESYDSRTRGWVKRRRADVEREAARDDPLIQAQFRAIEEATRKQGEDLSRAIMELAKAQAAPREDPMAKWLEVEKGRLAADAEAKRQELAYMKAKLDSEATEAERRRQHEQDLFERKIEAERQRAESERHALEARLQAEKERIEADRKIAQDRLEQITRISEEKIERAHETMLEMVREKSSPTDQLMNLLGTVHEVAGTLGYTPPGGATTVVDGVAKPASPVDKIVEVARAMANSSAGQKLANVLIDALKSNLDKTITDAAIQGAQGAPKQLAPPPPAATAAPTPPPAAAARAAAGAVEPPHEPTAEERAQAIKSIVTMLEEIDSAMDRGLSANVAWTNVVDAVGSKMASQLSTYTDADALLAELSLMPLSPEFSAHADLARRVAEKAGGPKKKWANEFIACVQKNKAK